MAVTRTAWEQAKNNPMQMRMLWQYASMEAGQKRVDAWLQEAGLYDTVNVGVVAIWSDDGEGLVARAKVIVKGCGSSFEHEEYPYLGFPSEHFKAKVLLVTGGPCP